jgi:ATP-dependent 26S proteasome regulatory subunit
MMKSAILDRLRKNTVSIDHEDYLDDEALEEAAMWAFSEGTYYASPKVVAAIEPGIYNIVHDYSKGICFEPIKLKQEELIRFSDYTTDQVIRGIHDFWGRKDLFRQYNITFKRGIFMYGPPGTGKSCTVQLVMEDVVERGGIAVSSWPGSAKFVAGMKLLRKIQPEIPVVIVLEDLDSIMDRENDSDLLNILDGVEHVDNIVFLATTNHVTKFQPRVINRPSRFDRKIEVGFPGDTVREKYLQALAGRNRDQPILNIDKWVLDTEGFSIAHLKELFISTVILGTGYAESLKILKDMQAPEKDEDEDDED